MNRRRLLCICPSFAPETTPTAIRAGALLERLGAHRRITVLTERGAPSEGRTVEVRKVRARRPSRALAAMRRLRLGKLLDLALWPDDSVFWVLPAIRAGRRALREGDYEAVVAFMMPYSSGLVGVALARAAKLPLVLNLDDSPTCSDMHPSYPSRLHHRLAVLLEDLFVRRADAVVYVSARNLERVARRHAAPARERLHLVRYGAEPDRYQRCRQPEGSFEIVYVGAMSGWWALISDVERADIAARMYRAWNRLGRHQRVGLDERTSSPAVVGRAVQRLLVQHEEWRGRIGVTVWGNPYPDEVVARALAAAGVADVVTVHGPVPHERVAQLMCGADVLFLTLPRRVDGSAGGRISAKTYEYLMTDRPILAAVSAGENRDFLAGRAGVSIVDPADEQAMAAALAPLAAAKLAGRAVAVERSRERDELSYEQRAREFEAVIEAARARARG